MAQWSADCLGGGLSGSEAADVATIKCFESLVGNLITSIMAFVGVGLFVMLLIGGFNFLFAGGDQKRLEKAKTTLSSAIGGLVVVVIAILIILAISEITGLTNLTNFEILYQ